MLTCYTQLVQVPHCTMRSDHCRNIPISQVIRAEIPVSGLVVKSAVIRQLTLKIRIVRDSRTIRRARALGASKPLSLQARSNGKLFPQPVSGSGEVFCHVHFLAAYIIGPTHGPHLWHETRPLRDYRAAWRGRDGRGLSDR